DYLVRRQGTLAFLHRRDQHAVGVSGPFERNHLAAALTDYRNHLTSTYGAECFLRLGEAHPKFREIIRRNPARGRRAWGGFQSGILFLAIISRGTNSPVVFSKLPMNRRIGRGNSFTRVGVATI